jgi:FHS family L-fucose permease-like MFS transporter
LAQLIFGVASFISPLVYSEIVSGFKTNDGSGFISTFKNMVPPSLQWISFYWMFTIISLLMILVIFLLKFPKVELKADEKAGALEAHVQLLKNPVVLLFFFGIFCYVGTEQGVANWISQFLSTYHGYDPQTTGAQTVAYFWGLMTAGGVLGLLLVKLMDSRQVLVLFTTLSIISFSIGLFGPGSWALVAFPLVGFFASVMYPIIVSLALNSVKEHHGSFAGILMTGIAGGAVVPLIVGWLGDHFGLRNGMLFLYITLGYILSVGIWAKPLVTNKVIRRKVSQPA